MWIGWVLCGCRCLNILLFFCGDQPTQKNLVCILGDTSLFFFFVKKKRFPNREAKPAKEIPFFDPHFDVSY